jgi:hypothetical protein
MNKGIATQTILLMLVGLIVVGILIFIVYRSIVSNPSLSEGECRARLTNYCIMCKNGGWGTGMGIPASLRTDCAKGIFAYWSDNNCCGDTAACGWTPTDCKMLGVE